MSDTSLRGKTAFVTGGHQGIGRTIVETLATAGVNVAAMDAGLAFIDVTAEMAGA